MSQVHKVNCTDVEGRDFAPSEMFLVVLTQDETAAMCKAALLWKFDKEQTLHKIFNASFRLLTEVLI